MVYSYTPAYYSSFQDTLTSVCKSILLPFSLKNRRLTGDQKLAKRQSDNLKWQQESFHRILNLIGLQKEGIVPESEVSAFRSHLIDILIASPREQEAVGVVRDKLLFLQELFYAKCISADEYHSSKRPLLQRLAVRDVEIDCKHVIIGDPAAAPEEAEEWSVIELRDKESPAPAEKTKYKTPIKSFISWRGKDKREQFKYTNAAKMENAGSILMPESSPTVAPKPDKSKRKQWGFDGLKKWKKANPAAEDENAAPHRLLGERSDDNACSSVTCTLVASPIHDDEGRDIKSIKKELCRIKSELSATHPNLNLSSRCDRYGDVVLDVVKKELKERAREKNGGGGGGFDGRVVFTGNEENYHPNNIAATLVVDDHQNPFWVQRN